ncbi:DoxX family protein [Pelagibacterium limicola]|uniref:DoxX family protein n=1 Tax=Pelagibacterium limicola TaxID=2791022 RepID=UPI0018B00018|nr:DoxX family protein [Pelagibacterium limicola]
MTTGKVAYWLSTVLLCLIYAAGAAAYVFQRPMVEEGFGHFGYPAYLVTVLIAAKIAAPLVILSRVLVRLSDLAYAGMLFHLLLAISAHLNAGDEGFFAPVFALALLIVSFLTQNSARKTASPNVPIFELRQTRERT